MIIRKGTTTDVNEMLRLITELAIFEREPSAVVISTDDLKRDGFGENPLFYTFIAEIDNQIVGMALYYNRYSTWKGKTIHLEDLIVSEPARGKGVGMALYKEIIKEGKAQNVRRIEWNVLDWNKPAIDFYEKSGAIVLKDWCNVQINSDAIDLFLEIKN